MNYQEMKSGLTETLMLQKIQIVVTREAALAICSALEQNTPPMVSDGVDVIHAKKETRRLVEDIYAQVLRCV